MNNQPTPESDVRDRMQDIASRIVERIPEGFTFMLFIAPSENATPNDGRANYISNMQRVDALNCMKEFIIKSGAEEDWMKHIK